jgi:hypothetical protein
MNGNEVLDKRQEARVRRLAVQYGYRVCKSRQRNNVPNLDNFGDYKLVDAAGNYPVLGFKYDATREDIEGYLNDYEVFTDDVEVV